MGHPCLFCERQVKLSDEHILLQWLLKSLGVHESQLGMTHHSTVGLPVSRRGPLPFANFINGRVCADCNNGWMSQLEADMKPQLEALMNLDLAALKGLESAAYSAASRTLIPPSAECAYRVSFQFRHLLLRAVFLPVQDAWLEDDVERAG